MRIVNFEMRKQKYISLDLSQILISFIYTLKKITHDKYIFLIYL